ncbi:MAG: hypothetical protein FVQ80_02670 [Planctomycetes bacterium]|nr:hypothetical protein [Planctomycetota bacterium]
MRNYEDSHATITDSDFIENSAGEEGGGLNNRKNSNAVITNCRFIGNTAPSGGGMENHVGRATPTGEPVIINCLFVNNVADAGGGMRNNDPNPIVINCTFSNNTGSGMSNRGGSVPIVSNCIFWSNTGGSFTGSSVPVVTYSNVWGGFAGAGNIDVDPFFADAAGGDYHLRSQAGRWDPNINCWVQDSDTSQCIDAGDPNRAIASELYPHGDVVNMGTYGGTAHASSSLLNGGNIADLNFDGIVNMNDFARIANLWPKKELFLPEDLNRDNEINGGDLSIFIDNWLWQ